MEFLLILAAALLIFDVYISAIFAFAKTLNINLMLFIKEKIKYNQLHDYKHGKKY